MWPQTASRGPLRLDRRAGSPRCRGARRRRSGRRGPAGGEWTTSTAPVGQSASIASAAASSERSKLQSQGVDRDPGAEAEELDPARSRRPRRGGPSPPPSRGRLAQGVLGLVVAGHEHRRRLDRRQGVDRLRQPLVDRGEVAGADRRASASAPISTRRAAWSRSRCRSLKASRRTARMHRARAARAQLRPALAEVHRLVGGQADHQRRDRQQRRERSRPRSRTGSAPGRARRRTARWRFSVPTLRSRIATWPSR